MKPAVVFWSHRTRPSFTMRGLQIAEALRQRGIAVEVRVGPSPWALRGLRDRVIVCVKSVPRWLPRLRRRGNRLVLDAIDFTPEDPVPDVDAVLCASRQVAAWLSRRVARARVETFYHHADPRILPHVAQSSLRLVYVGERKNSALLDGQLPELHVVDFKRPGWERRLRDYDAHFSARLDPTKSVVKLANCAAAEAVFLAGPEPGAVELLGEDYPFFFDPASGLAGGRAAVRRLAEAHHGPLWREAAARIRALRERLSLAASAAQYEALLRELS